MTQMNLRSLRFLLLNPIKRLKKKSKRKKTKDRRYKQKMKVKNLRNLLYLMLKIKIKLLQMLKKMKTTLFTISMHTEEQNLSDSF